MANYLIFIYGDDQQWAAMSPQEQQELDEGHRVLQAAAGSAIVEGYQLEPAPTATSLRTDPAGRLTTTDGPFLETKEALGGYYVLELASRLPEISRGHSGVEIRPVVNHG